MNSTNKTIDKDRQAVEETILIVLSDVKIGIDIQTLVQKCQSYDKELSSSLIKIAALGLVSEEILFLNNDWTVRLNIEK